MITHFHQITIQWICISYATVQRPSLKNVEVVLCFIVDIVLQVFFVVHINTQHFAHQLLHLQEAPQLIQFPDGLDAHTCVALYQIKAALEDNPVLINLRIAAALLEYHALLTEAIEQANASEKGITAKHIQLIEF